MPHRLFFRAAQLAMAVLAAAYLVYFADHARQLFGFGFPLDYGEGPLQAQVDRLLGGTPVWKLYADPSQSPFQIVNYPPLYLLATAALAPLTGSALLAGRLVSLLATLGAVAAITLLARPQKHRSALHPSSFILHPSSFLLPPLLLLAVPVVREWSVLMRVDMLGVCLGLWGLLALTRAVSAGEAQQQGTPADASGSPFVPTARRLRLYAALAGLLILAGLYTKPSLIAAPLAAAGWLAWRLWVARDPERRAALTAAIALGTAFAAGALLFGLLEWASGGWFALHVVAANANRWDAALARGFWEQQLQLRWALAAAAALAAVVLIARRRAGELVLPGLYTLGGVIVAIGVGKVGAYSNYFLELYAGLIWLTTLGATALSTQHSALSTRAKRSQHSALARSALSTLFYALLAASLLYYPPLWDANRLRPAGLIEPSPPRLALGRYGLWDDAARERDLLAAQTRVHTALAAEVHTAGPTIFSDMPGVASAAGVLSRLQAFEARQLFDQGLAADDALLLELANGELPLAVIDYLGNWLSPGVIEILQRRYAHDGSLGTFDLYRPVDAGPLRPLDLTFDAAGAPLALAGFSLAAPLGDAYEPGELLALSLAWRRGSTVPPDDLTAVVQLATPDGAPLLESERPLLYNVLPPRRWPEGVAVEHMHPLELPPELPKGSYTLAVGLRQAGHDLGPTQIVGSLAVAPQGGAYAESGQFVPASFQRAWAELGATERAGLPLTPAVPFAWGRLQCFERVCLELRDGQVRQRPLGTQLYLAETIRGDACAAGEPGPDGFCSGFAEAPLVFADLGAPISGELTRNGWLVQWTEYARLERSPDNDPPALGRLGDESLRLPPGTPYRWP